MAKILTAITIFILFISIVRYIDSLPIVFVSWTTGECTKVIKHGKDCSCSDINLINDKYIEKKVR